MYTIIIKNKGNILNRKRGGPDMPFGFYLRCFYGFVIQLLPCSLLLPLPFDSEKAPQPRRRSFLLPALVALGFSLCFPPVAWWGMTKTDRGNLVDNLYMLLAILAVTAVFFMLFHANNARKLTVLFIVISYAAVQFFLSNMLMDFLPFQKADLVYDDATLAAFTIVTAVLLPPMVLFMKRTVKDYLRHLTDSRLQPEFVFLLVVFVLYLVLNALYASLWVELRDRFQLGFQYFIPYSLFLSLLLMFTFFSTIRLAVTKSRNAEQALELALMQQDYHHIEESMQQQRQALHDMRQLLRSISAIARDGTKEELLKYLDESLENAEVSDTRFCANSCLNGILQYYAALAEKQGIRFSVQAVCGRLPFSNTDMTILFSNVLDNALRAAAEFGGANPGICPEVRFTADQIEDQFAVLIENSCLSVSRSKASLSGTDAGQDVWLSADAFQSMHRGGYGLKRVEMIAGKYEGYARFSFDPDRHLFITRLILPLSEV